jgi:hypothetical protein
VERLGTRRVAAVVSTSREAVRPTCPQREHWEARCTGPDEAEVLSASASAPPRQQVTVYEDANNTKKSIKVILYFDRFKLIRVTQLLEDLGLVNREDVVLIDARNDNKPSGSNA